MPAVSLNWFNTQARAAIDGCKRTYNDYLPEERREQIKLFSLTAGLTYMIAGKYFPYLATSLLYFTEGEVAMAYVRFRRNHPVPIRLCLGASTALIHYSGFPVIPFFLMWGMVEMNLSIRAKIASGWRMTNEQALEWMGGVVAED